MKQRELNREIARVTGESVETIAALGFGLLSFSPPLVEVDQRTRLRDITRYQRNIRRTASTPKSSVRQKKKPVPAVARHPAENLSEWQSTISTMPIRKLVFFDRGA